MTTLRLWFRLSVLAGLCGSVPSAAAADDSTAPLVFCCAKDNDLYRVLDTCGMRCPRCDGPMAAVSAAREGGAVLLLADQYPRQTQTIAPAVFETARRKGLRLYVEYPGSLPGLEVGKPRPTRWERGVITSKAFGAKLQPMRIVAIHDCHFVPLTIETPHMVVAKVAGFDTAVYGLPEKNVWPILFAHPDEKVLVATTKLSQFVTARYAPTDAWGTVWQMILAWLQPGRKVPELKWSPVVRPSYGRDEPLPPDAELTAIGRGNEWVLNARMLIHPSWHGREFKNWDERFELPPGDGGAGILEGFQSRIRYDGSQAVRPMLRSDCTGEQIAPFVLAGVLLKDPKYVQIGRNLADFVLFKFEARAPWRQPSHAAYGLIGWCCDPSLAEPVDTAEAFYGVINARICMSTLAAAGLLAENRWDDRMLQVMLANHRTTGPDGFRITRLSPKQLETNGWQHYYTLPYQNLSPMPTAQLLAANLAVYKATGYRPLLDRTKRALRMLMEAYPDKWNWWNGLQQERARLILPLAWLVRLEDTPEHRAWLEQMTNEFLRNQVACGAVREELGEPGKGKYPAPPSNEAYGTTETPLIQNNGEPVCDLLYTLNSGFLGLHEAAAATGDPELRKAEDRLAQFLCRIQTRSEKRPELDGTWYRAFDYERWDYWASNADAGWGAWCTETGWIQGWIVTTLALRQLHTSLWDLTTKRSLQPYLDRNLKQMLPGKNH